MRLITNTLILATIVSTFSMVSCKDALDVYLGIPLQPTFDENDFTPGLNIFGVLRTDSTSGFNNSFVEVQKVVAAVGDSSGWDVDSATVIITQAGSEDTETEVEFAKTTLNHIFEQENYRPTVQFKPRAGHIFNIECISGDLPILTAQAIVPNKPSIVDNSLAFSNHILEFELQSDTSYYMVVIYAFANGEIASSMRSATTQDIHTAISFDDLDTKPDSIQIYTYDKNLSTYYLTSNISLNFNKYRASFSTVDNGYGVFGAINQSTFIVP